MDGQLGVVEAILTNIHRPNNLMLSPDGSYLYVASDVLSTEDGRITIVDTESLEVVAAHTYPNPENFGYARNVRGMALGPINKLHIAPQGYGGSNAIDTMDLASGEIVATLPFSGLVNSLASFGDTLYATYWENDENSLLRFDIATGVPISETAVSVADVGTLTLTPDGFTLLLLLWNGVIHQYDAHSLELIRTYETGVENGFVSIGVSPDSQSLIGLYRPYGYYGTGGLQVFDLATGQLQRTFIDNNEFGTAYHTALFADGEATLLYYDGVRLLIPADYHVALPVAFYDYCAHPVVDDFSNPTSGWPIYDTGNTIYRYLNGEYNIYHRKAGSWAAASRGDFWNRSQKVQATGRIIQNQGVWGLLFGMQNNWSDFYTFEIDPHQQKWFFLRFINGVGWQLINEGSSHSIHSGSAYNTLSITDPYGELIFHINDTIVLTKSFENHRTGYVGLTGASFQNNVDIRFNDYLFVDAGCPMPLQNMPGYSTGEFLSLERPDIQEILSGNEEP
jgi:hypothetical protein